MRTAGAHAISDDIELPMMSLPFLAELAVVAALVDLLLNRLWLRSAPQLAHSTLVEVAEWGAFPRNLAAVAGIIALLATLVAFLRTRLYLPLLIRIGVAGFSGIFVPTILLATVLPGERTTSEIVLFATATAHLLVVFYGVASIRWDLPATLRFANLAMAAAGLLGLLSLVVELVVLIYVGPADMTLAKTLRFIGEAAWLGTAPLVAASLPRKLKPLIGAGLAALGVTLMVLALRGSLAQDFAPVLYGALRVELFLGGASWLYAPLLGIVAGTALAALLSTTQGDRQLGVGILLLGAAAYSPRAPGLLLLMVLGAALIWRGSVTRATVHTIRQALRPLHPSETDPS